jgi:hypothetical protein
MKAYRQWRHCFPIKLPHGPQGKVETIFEELCVDVALPPEKERPQNQSISKGTWVLINQWAALRQAGKLEQRRSCVIERQIKATLASNRKQHTATVRDKIEGLMAAGELKETWRCLKGWYSTVEDCAPKASHNTLVRQTEKRIALYASVTPPGRCCPSMGNLLTLMTTFAVI